MIWGNKSRRQQYVQQSFVTSHLLVLPGYLLVFCLVEVTRHDSIGKLTRFVNTESFAVWLPRNNILKAACGDIVQHFMKLVGKWELLFSAIKPLKKRLVLEYWRLRASISARKPYSISEILTFKSYRLCFGKLADEVVEDAPSTVIFTCSQEKTRLSGIDSSSKWLEERGAGIILFDSLSFESVFVENMSA